MRWMVRTVTGFATAGLAVACSLVIGGCEAPPPELEGLEVAIVPAQPTATDDLTATVVVQSAAWGTEGFYYEYYWTRDDTLVSELSTRTVDASYTTEGETWAVQVGPVLEWEEVILETSPAVASALIAPPSGGEGR